MKTTLIISAALLFSLASIAQTNAKNSEAVKDATTLGADKNGSKVSSSGSASSSTTVQSNAVPATESKVASKTEKSKEAIAAEKQETTAKAKNEGQEIKTTVVQSSFASARVQSSSKMTVDGKSNKINEKSSINGPTTAPSAKAKTTGSHNPKPASIKMNAKVKTNAAIRIN